MATGMTEKIEQFYDWSVAVADPRVERWLLMSGPGTSAVIFVLYLLVVWYGPRFMASRQPFNLKTILIPYNLSLVALSVYMFYEFTVTAILSGYSLRCQPVDYSSSPLAMRMASVCWWFFFSKVIELLDTVFFIARKADRQVTFLHVYHHCSMIINWYLGVKYVAGGQCDWGTVKTTVPRYRGKTLELLLEAVGRGQQFQMSPRDTEGQ